ncbi:hypothetical protein RUM43_014393 [Polyplax serrata]|uniref:Uncharacterized protein n=1 Tax=Polyplax serrata TaxID=468196 RepID=A0AAN8S6S0_POLSC
MAAKKSCQALDDLVLHEKTMNIQVHLETVKGPGYFSEDLLRDTTYTVVSVMVTNLVLPPNTWSNLRTDNTASQKLLKQIAIRTLT